MKLEDVENYNENIKAKVNGVFTSDKCTVYSNEKKINSLFDPKNTYKNIGGGEGDYLYVYSDNNSLLLHYYVSFEKKKNASGSEYISDFVIASRLDNQDADVSDKNIESREQKAGGADDDRILHKVIDFMESLDSDSKVGQTKISKEELNQKFVTSAENKLTSMYKKVWLTPTIMYTKYTLKPEGAAGLDHSNYKEIFEDTDDGTELYTKTYYFKVLFKGFQYKNNFYFEKTIKKKEILTKTGYTGPFRVPDAELPLSRTSSNDSIQSVPGGGGNTKLKRKELNAMSLNELKQLHRNNGIKMNSNKTVNALINNYIKHH